MLMTEYMSLLNLMRVLGFKQSSKSLTKFYIICDGNIKAQIVNEPDQEYQFKTPIEVDLDYDKIHLNYSKYVALESGRLTWINCHSTSKFSTHDFLMEYCRILDGFYDSTIYEFTSINYDEKIYEARTAMEIVRKSLKG